MGILFHCFLAGIYCLFENVNEDARRHQHGRWLARIGKVARNKDLYLGHSRNAQKIDDIL
ncbi:hypothetical protein DVH24_021575 [Malus domestica]|uniref:Uncharacterized protein n=1 Tax=Malus domestica TaxID=3750 RepID=A0A498K0G0_MALDO|nr:hypothetical protein DVH24_021575 [Malus domestica]